MSEELQYTEKPKYTPADFGKKPLCLTFRKTIGLRYDKNVPVKDILETTKTIKRPLCDAETLSWCPLDYFQKEMDSFFEEYTVDLGRPTHWSVNTHGLRLYSEHDNESDNPKNTDINRRNIKEIPIDILEGLESIDIYFGSNENKVNGFYFEYLDEDNNTQKYFFL